MATDRPNVIFILTDDQGVWAAGCYGNPEIRTPNIDRLAARGMRFENFFVASPVCSPSRASFLTGRMPSQHGVHDWIRGGNVGRDSIRYLQDEVAYTDVLAANGWKCGISGKWHLGDSEIAQHGFDHWYVHQFGGGRYNDPPMIRDGEAIVDSGYVTNLITDDALQFLDSHGAGGAPFYLSVHYTAPHSPWTGHPQDIVDSYDGCAFESCPQEPRHPWAISLTDQCLGDREMLKGYFAAVTAMDADVGRILDKLDELGISESTLVVFTSDNGFSCGHHGFWGKGNGTWPLNMYENSIKVPFIASHPGVIPEGAVESALVSACDFMPTLLDYLGLPLPESVNLPGESFSCLLRRNGGSGRESVVIYDEYGSTRMIRTHDWKYVHRYPDGPNELFDLTNDPDERRNLIDEPGQAARVAEMKGRLEEWFDAYAVPDMDGRGRGVQGGGQLTRLGAPGPEFTEHS
ncbi:MAG: sulfatase-like hydrolase/transferase [Chloroflexi bacterium]|nr:sulfatase-like hydrolase/transferase [Chloroflexota bacterium]MCY3937550.1 sulfatase-like hydrolase/transferase [Chloroflexota bacterium]